MDAQNFKKATNPHPKLNLGRGFVNKDVNKTLNGLDHRVYIPNFFCILRNGAIARKLAHAGGV